MREDAYMGENASEASTAVALDRGEISAILERIDELQRRLEKMRGILQGVEERD
jgi:tetrahydromethanopterin S-methyltransferase subunit G